MYQLRIGMEAISPPAAGERSPGAGSPVEGGPPGSHHPIMGPGRSKFLKGGEQ